MSLYTFAKSQSIFVQINFYSIIRSLLKAAVSFSILGSPSVVDSDHDTDQSPERRSNSPNGVNKLVTINEFLKEIEMTQNTKK